MKALQKMTIINEDDEDDFETITTTTAMRTTKIMITVITLHEVVVEILMKV